MRSMTVSRALIGALLPLVLAACVAKANIYNLSDDWSDAANPNGAWSYVVKGALGVSGTRTADSFSGPVPIWGENTATYVGWSKSNGNEAINHWDLQTGDVYGHTPSSDSIVIQWTSPSAGHVDVSGDLWALRDIGRVNLLELTLNGSVVGEDHVLIGTGQGWTRSNPFSFDDDLDVQTGDIIGLRASHWAGDHQEYGDYVGMNVALELTPVAPPVPLPGALLLGSLGLGVAGWRLKRKAQ
jgi:hypothetical protein